MWQMQYYPQFGDGHNAKSVWLIPGAIRHSRSTTKWLHVCEIPMPTFLAAQNLPASLREMLPFILSWKLGHLGKPSHHLNGAFHVGNGGTDGNGIIVDTLDYRIGSFPSIPYVKRTKSCHSAPLFPTFSGKQSVPDRCPGAVPPGFLGREVRVEAGGILWLKCLNWVDYRHINQIENRIS